MKDLKLEIDSHDLFFNTKGDIVFIENDEYIQQKLKIKLRFFFKEWFLDSTKGVDFYDTIFKKGTSLSTIDTLIKATIAEVEEVIEILSYSSNFVNRKFSVVFNIKTIYGQTTLNEEFNI